tara:strand:- start:1300 stop:1539 length:240 start_codon:yes stop_codon:yes gene_type:complete
MEIAKPPTMWFKCEKYRRMGDSYLNTIKKIIDMLFDEQGIEGMYYNILFESGHEAKAKKPLNKKQIFTSLDQLEKLAKE